MNATDAGKSGNFNQNPCIAMIKYTPACERKLSLFKTPFEQKLDQENRWVKMAEVVPWDEMAKVFFSRMSRHAGRISIDLRVVLGALLVKLNIPVKVGH
jgi:hypothetical protein